MAKKASVQKGDKVRHKFGSPIINVVSLNKKTGKVTCQWFTTTGQFQEVSFDADSLVKYEGPPSMMPELFQSEGTFHAKPFEME